MASPSNISLKPRNGFSIGSACTNSRAVHGSVSCSWRSAGLLELSWNSRTLLFSLCCSGVKQSPCCPSRAEVMLPVRLWWLPRDPRGLLLVVFCQATVGIHDPDEPSLLQLSVYT